MKIPPQPEGAFANPQAEVAKERRQYQRLAWRVSLYYALGSVLWLAITDGWVAKHATNSNEAVLLSLAKGSFFVIITAILLGLYQRRVLGRLGDANGRLATKEQRYRSLVESLPDAVLIEQGGVVVFANPAADRLFGAPEPGALVGRHLLGLVDALHHASVRLRLDRLPRDPEAGQPRARKLRRVDGSTFEGESALSTCEFNGQPAVQVVVRDVTQRLAAMRVAERSEGRLRTVVEAVPDAIVIQTGNGIAYVNPAALRLLGAVAPEQLLGRSVDEFADPTNAGELREWITRIIRERLAVPRSERTLVRLEGVRIQAEVSAVPFEYAEESAALLFMRDITESRHAAQALQESEARYRMISENSGDVVWLYDLETEGFTYVSLSLQRLLGFRPDEVVGRYMTILLTPASCRAVAGELPARIRALESGDSRARLATIDLELVHRDGRTIPAELVTTLLVNPQGRVDRLLGVARDISARRQAEARLREQSHLLQAILRSAPDVIFVQDRHGRYLLANGPAARLVGHPVEALIGCDDATLLPGEAGLRSQAENAEILRTGVAGEIDVTRVIEGRERHWVGTKSPLRDEQGDVIGLVGVARDITERRRIERELRRSEAIFTAFMAYLPGAAYIKNAARQHVFVNPTFERMLGVEPGQGLGKTLEEIVPGPTADLIRAFDEEVMNTGRPLTREVAGAGSKVARTFLVTKFAIEPAEGGRLLGGISLDITDRKRNEESLHELTGELLRVQDAERRRLARELHDNTAQNLSAVGMNLTRLYQLIAPGSAELEAVLADCSVLVDACSQEIRTMSYLLHPPLLDEVGLPAALREYLAGLSRRTYLRTQFHCSEEFGRLASDLETALFRIAQEALGNVVRHSQSREAFVRLERDNSIVVLEIRDTGCGLPAEKLQPLQTGSAALGVGIPGMRERLRQLGGVLNLDSRPGETRVRATVRLA